MYNRHTRRHKSKYINTLQVYGALLLLPLSDRCFRAVEKTNIL